MTIKQIMKENKIGLSKRQFDRLVSEHWLNRAVELVTKRKLDIANVTQALRANRWRAWNNHTLNWMIRSLIDLDSSEYYIRLIREHLLQKGVIERYSRGRYFTT